MHYIVHNREGLSVMSRQRMRRMSKRRKKRSK
jgi:hypothetical protein